MPDEPLIHRDEVASLLFAVYDILAELQAIRELLEENGEEEEGV